MAKTISQLAIKLGLDATQLQRGTDLANAKLQGFGDRAKRLGPQAQAASRGLGGMSGGLSSVAGMAMKLAGPLAAAGAAFVSLRTVVAGVSEAFGRLDETAKFADRIGIAVPKLEALKLAAQGGGAEIGTLQTSLQRLTRRVSEAAQGSGVAVKALQELGLSAEAMARLSPDEQFKRVADAMQGVSQQGDRVRLAMALFDTEGVALLNTLEGIAGDGLAKVEERAAALGQTVSRMDIARIEEMNDAWLEVQTAMKGVWNQLAVAVAPVFTRFLQNVVIPLAEGLVKVAQGMRRVVDWMGFATDKQEGLNQATEAAKDNNAELIRQAQAMEAQQKKAAENLKKQTEEERKRIDAAVKAFKAEEDARLAAAMRTSVRAAPTIGAVTAGSAGAMAAVQQVTNEAKARARNEERQRKALAESAKRREAFLKDIKAQLQRLNRREPVTVNEVSAIG